MKVLLWAILGVFLIVTPSISAVPQTLSYQGVLTDGVGNLVADGNYSITFRLYDDPTLSGAHLLWTEAHDGAGVDPPQVAVSKGGFNVILGSAVTLPPFNNPFWLEIQVSPNPAVAPRIPLTASPYSLNARNVYDGGGNGFVGVGRSSPVTSNEYFGVLAPVTTGYGGMYIQTQGANSLPFYGYYDGTDAAWTYLDGSDPNKSWKVHNSGDRLVVTNSGNVGIGTSTPGALLEVAGGTKLGSDAPVIKTKKLTGTTSANDGGFVAIPLGLDATKILSVSVMVEYTPGAGSFVPPSFSVSSGENFRWYTDGTGPNIVVVNEFGNDSQILSKPIKILIIYEQ